MELSVGPDLEHIAVVVARYDADVDRLLHQVHIVGRDGRLATVTADPPRDVEQRRPRWSADGSRLAWSEGTGDERHVVVVDLVRSDADDLPQVDRSAPWRTRMSGAVTLHDLSPDGRLLLVGIDVRDVAASITPVHWRSPMQHGGGRHELWQVPVGGGEPRRCWSGDAPVTAVAWDGSGERYAFVATRRPSVAGPVGSSLWIGEVGRDPQRAVIGDHGPILALAWAPDDRRLAFLGTEVPGDRVGERRLWVLDGDVRRVAPGLDRSIGQVVRGDDERGIGPPSLCWTPDGGAILAPVAVGGRSVLMRFDVTDAAVMAHVEASEATVVVEVVETEGEPTDGDGCVLEFAMANDGGTVVSWSSPGQPGELSILSGGRLERLTRLNDGWLAAVTLAPTIDVLASVDGHEVEGWLTLPLPTLTSSAAGPTGAPPVIVELHGGPHYPIGRRFSLNAQRWAGQGYAVLRPNPSGSQGYGAEFARATEGDWGGRDLADVLAVLDAALGSVPLDATRVAIAGESYGGFLAAWALASTDRFIAGVAENGVSDLFAATLRDPLPTTWTALPAPPWRPTELGRTRSPALHAAGIEVPVLLIRAVDDVVVEPYQVLALWHALVALGSDVELLELPGEGHFINVTGRPSSRLFRSQVVDDWFARKLAAG
jgi:dipeptidyl aminopeptidase/acylaminoacyl peptidase